MIELTHSDYATLWPETLPLVDLALERGAIREVSGGEAAWVLEDASRWCAPHTHDYPPVLRPYAAEAVAPIFSAERFERMVLALMHRNCPLRFCEDFDMLQQKVPRKLGPSERVWTTEFSYGYGIPITIDQGGDDRYAAMRYVVPGYNCDFARIEDEVLAPLLRRVVRIANIKTDAEGLYGLATSYDRGWVRDQPGSSAEAFIRTMVEALGPTPQIRADRDVLYVDRRTYVALVQMAIRHSGDSALTLANVRGPLQVMGVPVLEDESP